MRIAVIGIALAFVTSTVTGESRATVISDDAIVADLDRERRLAEQIGDAILDGERILLDGEPGHRFLGIYTEAGQAEARGTVILLHGRGLHPDWTDVVQPLRIGLADAGWHTLSVQMPVLGKQAKYYEYTGVFDTAVPRIESAIALARQSTSGPVVLLSHSCGTHMAQHWIRERGDAAVAQIDAFVGIGMGATDLGQPMRVPFVLDALSVPVLDVYADDDFRAVKRLAPTRWQQMQRGGNPLNAQRVVADSEHYFVDRGDALLEVVADWLATL